MYLQLYQKEYANKIMVYSQNVNKMLFFEYNLSLIDLFNRPSLENCVTHGNFALMKYLNNKKINFNLNFLYTNGDNLLLKLTKIIIKKVNKNLNINKGIKIFNFLVDNGINLNYQNKKGNTPLILLFSNVSSINIYTVEKLIKYLINNGANINISNNQNNSALYYITRKRECIGVYNELAKYLISNGAKHNIKNNRGYLPIITKNIFPNLRINQKMKNIFDEMTTKYESYSKNKNYWQLLQVHAKIKMHCIHYYVLGHKYCFNFKFINICYNYKQSFGIKDFKLDLIPKVYSDRKMLSIVTIEYGKTQFYLHICDYKYMEEMINNAENSKIFLLVSVRCLGTEYGHSTIMYIDKINKTCMYINSEGILYDHKHLMVENLFSQYFNKIGYKYIYTKEWNKNNICTNFETTFSKGYCVLLSCLFVDTMKNYNITPYEFFEGFVNLSKQEKFNLIDAYGSYLYSLFCQTRKNII